MKTHRFTKLAEMGLAALLAGCTAANGTRSTDTTPMHHSGMGSPGRGMMGETCPMQVPGTTVTAIEVEGGAALEFTTPTGSVPQLRQRVRAMAGMHEQHAGGGMMMPAATTSVEDIEGGARLVFRPRAPAQLDALREHARTQADQMARGECPMMSGPHGQATPSSSAGEPCDRAHHRSPGG